MAQVRSGDTLVLEDGLVVRLAGIDAPNSDQPYAEEATRALTELAAGQEVQLLYGGARRDHYGRALAQVRIKASRLWLQKRLIQDGDARVRTYADNRALAQTLLVSEDKARRLKTGLWSLDAYRVLLPVEASNRSGFQIIEGRVTGAYSAPRGAEIDLDDKITAAAPQALLKPLANTGRDLGRLKGRLVRVRGYLDRDRGLVLDHPEQLELLREPK